MHGDHESTVSSGDLRFTEIEHKFIVEASFDLPRFRDQLAALKPTRTGAVTVRDRFFLTAGGRVRRVLFRHRFDAELHHLTVKSVEPDPEVRLEVNLELSHQHGSQDAQVDAFLSQMDVIWRGTLHKTLEVWYFPDCEAVYYEAFTPSRSVRCVEFEATHKGSLGEALATLERFERATGFAGASRSLLSLPQLLFPDLGELLARGGEGQP